MPPTLLPPLSVIIPLPPKATSMSPGRVVALTPGFLHPTPAAAATRTTGPTPPAHPPHAPATTKLQAGVRAPGPGSLLLCRAPSQLVRFSLTPTVRRFHPSSPPGPACPFSQGTPLPSPTVTFVPLISVAVQQLHSPVVSHPPHSRFPPPRVLYPGGLRHRPGRLSSVDASRRPLPPVLRAYSAVPPPPLLPPEGGRRPLFFGGSHLGFLHDAGSPTSSPCPVERGLGYFPPLASTPSMLVSTFLALIPSRILTPRSIGHLRHCPPLLRLPAQNL